MVVKIINYMKMRPLKCCQFAKLWECMETNHVTLIQSTCICMAVSRKHFIAFLRAERGDADILFSWKLQGFWRSTEQQLLVFQTSLSGWYIHELIILNNGMQPRHETSWPTAFLKKLVVWKKHASTGKLENLFPSVVQNQLPRNSSIDCDPF